MSYTPGQEAWITLHSKPLRVRVTEFREGWHSVRCYYLEPDPYRRASCSDPSDGRSVPINCIFPTEIEAWRCYLRRFSNSRDYYQKDVDRLMQNLDGLDKKIAEVQEIIGKLEQNPRG